VGQATPARSGIDNGREESHMKEDPNIIVLEYPAQCEECDVRIPKGALAYLCPVTDQLLCLGGEGCGEKARESAKGK